MSNKANYKRWIWTYKRRRESLRVKSKVMTEKIKIWQRKINRIDSKSKQLNILYKAVNEYFDLDISDECVKPKYNLARNIFYKMAIENKIEGKFVSEYIGRYKKTAGECRLSFSRSFNKNQNNKEVYHSFKKYFEN